MVLIKATKMDFKSTDYIDAAVNYLMQLGDTLFINCSNKNSINKTSTRQLVLVTPGYKLAYDDILPKH